MADEMYANIREVLGPCLGQRVMEITQHDADEFEDTRECYVMLHFENGVTLRFPITDDGFVISELDGGD